MIITKLIGGLGNQLFQYAVARHLAERKQTILKIDISSFETYKLHKYSLWPFNIQENFASFEEVASLKKRKHGIIDRTIMRILQRQSHPLTYVREKSFHFDPEILNLPSGTYLEGYWQSEKYFKNIEEIIRWEFTVKTMQTGRDRALAREIESCESVSVHIRRRDYVSDPNTNQVHGVCDINYYYCCAECLRGLVKTPLFYVFSDDPEWVYKNFTMPGPTTIIDHNGAEKCYEDLRLMSLCKHHIIANSTFSWWGAWLSTNQHKIVFAPKKWFNTNDRDTKDLIPDGWFRI